MNVSGKLVIFVIFGTSLAAAVFAWWYIYNQSDEARDFWGTDASVAIRLAAKVELLELHQVNRPATNVVEHLFVADQPRDVVRLLDISEAKGLVHARHALIQNNSFEWEKSRGDCQPSWPFLLRFTDDKYGAATIAIDFDCGRVRLVGGDAEAAAPKLTDALKELIGRQLKEAEDREAAQEKDVPRIPPDANRN